MFPRIKIMPWDKPLPSSRKYPFSWHRGSLNNDIFRPKCQVKECELFIHPKFRGIIMVRDFGHSPVLWYFTGSHFPWCYRILYNDLYIFTLTVTKDWNPRSGWWGCRNLCMLWLWFTDPGGLLCFNHSPRDTITITIWYRLHHPIYDSVPCTTGVAFLVLHTRKFLLVSVTIPLPHITPNSFL